MAEHKPIRKDLSINPLRMSAPLGGAMAFLGVDGCLPTLHGSQGCTAFGLVLLVRHFRESIPFQTTAMNEVTTILGGVDNLEQACLNIAKRAKPKMIGICSTGLVETRGEDLRGDMKLIRARNPELADTALVYVNTPDFVGALQDGWAKAVRAMIDELTLPTRARVPGQVAVLAGSHLTPGDLEEIREMIGAFGLSPVILPDLSGSLDGHVPDQWIATSFGGTSVEDIRSLGQSIACLALGEQMRPPAELLAEKSAMPVHVFDRLTGLAAVDRFVSVLQDLSGTKAPAKLRRQRSQLQDAMLDGHFFFGGKKVAIAAEPDLLLALSGLFTEMGAEVATAVTSTHSPVLAEVAAPRVVIGDLDDLEQGAAGCDLLVTHSHGRQASARLGIPLFRAGFPQFDRLGAQHQRSVGYRGTRDLIFAIGNTFLENEHQHTRPGLHAGQEDAGASPARH
jgi:nitrogenase molybdenum-iron protein NifN